MYEVTETFGSRKFCGFLKFRPNLRKFMTFKIWKAPFKREMFWFPSFGKVDAIFLTFSFFVPGHVAILCYFFLNLWKVYAPVISDFGQFTKVNSSWNVCHFVIHESLSQKFSKILAKVFNGESFCPSALNFFFFPIYLLTYDYPCTEMSIMPYSITNSILWYCSYTVILRMLE